ncbi:MAG: chemotaxis protein CheC [Candidatus Omnitrophota bacterium]
MDDQENKINKVIRLISQLSIDRASQVFSKFIKTAATIELEKAYMTDITAVSGDIGQMDKEVVGVFVDITGEADLKFLFFVEPQGCKILTDLILKRAAGTTTELDVYAKSAVQEIGNIIASAISNVFSADCQIAIRPSPPVVVHDFVGTLLEEYLLDVAAKDNKVLIIQSKFYIVSQNIDCCMFLMPTGNSEKILSLITEPT